MITTFLLNELSAFRLLSQVTKIIAGALLLALCSQIKIPLPFSIIPITLQTLFVLLLGGLLGRTNAACAVLGYFAQIMMGMPVLAGGDVNPFVFIGPKGGYLFGMLVQAYLMGWAVEKFETNFTKLMLAGLCLCTIQLAMGAGWLAHFIGIEKALFMGFYPFILGEALKVTMVCSILVNKKYTNSRV